MKIRSEMMVRYGEPDFDEEYVKWGFHDERTQVCDAKSALAIIPAGCRKLLDVACGTGRYHKIWLETGLSVTGVDLSDTFIRVAVKENACYPNAKYVVTRIEDMEFHEEFDAVTWIDPAFFSGRAAKKIMDALKPGGIFLYDLRNPNHPRYRKLEAEARTWSFTDGVYTLIRDEKNIPRQYHEHEEVTIDTVRGEIVSKKIETENISLLAKQEILWAAGFNGIRMVCRSGEGFDPNDETPQRIWLAGCKD